MVDSNRSSRLWDDLVQACKVDLCKAADRSRMVHSYKVKYLILSAASLSL